MNDLNDTMYYPIDLEQLLNLYGLSDPDYHYHKIPYQHQTYHECIVELPDLYIQTFAIAPTEAQAKADATHQAMDKIKSLKLFPEYHISA